jgi:glycosyltransferase involved in cell wall biosynthesis
MNILLVAPYRLAGTGGIATFVSRLQEELTASGHRVLVLVAGDTDRVAPDGSGRRETYGIYLRSMYVKGRVFKGFAGFCLYLPVSLFQLWRFLRREAIDVVHVNFVTPSALYFCALRAFGGWRLIATTHGSDVYALPRRTRLHRFLIRLALSRCDLITTVSRDLLDALHRAYPALGTPTRVIPNGNPLGAGSLPADPPGARIDLPDGYVLAVGSLIVRKGYDILIEALWIARSRGHDLSLVILGAGPELAKLEAQATALGVRDFVRLAGEVPHREVLSYYARAKFFVHAAREEAQGLVLLEAMSCRKAVVAPRVSGIPELIRDGETGLLVEAGNPAALADALIRMNSDQVLRDTLAEQGFRHVNRQHSWRDFVTKYVEAYDAVLSTRRSGRGDCRV